MAARSYSSRQLLCGALCSLLWLPLIRSLPAGTTRVRNGVTYTLKSETMHSWSDAMALCPSGLLWVRDVEEAAWVKSEFELRRSIWLAAKGTDSQWPNGESFPTGTPRPNEAKCLLVYVTTAIKWDTCSKSFFVICKPFSLATSTPAPAPSCGRFPLLFRRLADGRSHGGAELREVRERSLVACGALCAGSPDCCVFEFWREAQRCRLLTATREALWTAQEGAELYSLEA